ncbi:hypothetical protein SANTM175S_05245 [Streptomyces antimycoticus]
MMWTGGLNDTLDADGQFPYGRDDFGSFTLLARLTVDIPDHDLSGVNGYRRSLDLAQGLVTSSYVRSGVTYRRQVFASHPDDAIVLHFTQSGGGHYTGTITLGAPTANSGSVTGLAARGGFVVDLRWKQGVPTSVRIHSVGGRTTTVAHGGSSRTIRLVPGESHTLNGFAR